MNEPPLYRTIFISPNEWRKMMVGCLSSVSRSCWGICPPEHLTGTSVLEHTHRTRNEYRWTRVARPCYWAGVWPCVLPFLVLLILLFLLDYYCRSFRLLSSLMSLVLEGERERFVNEVLNEAASSLSPVTWPFLFAIFSICLLWIAKTI